MNETALEILKVLAGLIGGGVAGLGTAWGAWARARAEAAKTAEEVKAEASKQARETRKETLDQSMAFSDLLLKYQDNIRAEMLTVYEHLHHCHDHEARMEGHIGYLEDRLGVPAEQRWKKLDRPAPVAPDFLKTPFAGQTADFIKRTNEQDSKVLHKAVEAKRADADPGGAD